MRKTISLALIAMFIISLVPFVFAQETNAEVNIEAEVNEGSEDSDDSSGRVEIRTKEEVRDDNIRTKTEVRIRSEYGNRLEEMRIKSRERLAKIQGLDQRLIDRLSELDVKNF